MDMYCMEHGYPRGPHADKRPCFQSRLAPPRQVVTHVVMLWFWCSCVCVCACVCVSVCLSIHPWTNHLPPFPRKNTPDFWVADQAILKFRCKLLFLKKRNITLGKKTFFPTPTHFFFFGISWCFMPLKAFLDSCQIFHLPSFFLQALHPAVGEARCIQPLATRHSSFTWDPSVVSVHPDCWVHPHPSPLLWGPVVWGSCCITVLFRLLSDLHLNPAAWKVRKKEKLSHPARY